MDGKTLSNDSDLKLTPLWQIWAIRAGILLLIVVAVLYAGRLGLQFRRWTWDTSSPIRFTSDIDRGFYWGREAALEGYANQYEKMQFQRPNDANWLDYAPLRLGVMTLWAKWAATHYPHVSQWHQNRSYALTAPVLWFNTIMELIGVASAFFLTRLWAIRGSRVGSALPIPHASFFHGWTPGLFAAALLWFNPAIVLSAYGWPTWDLWIVPMFLLAVLLASLDWWFTAGVIIGIGAMFKGQQLIALPVFLLWAIILGRPLSSLRMLAGVTIAVAVVALPWLVTYLPSDRLATARIAQSHHQAAQVPDGTFAIARVFDVWAIIWVIGVLFAAVATPFVARLRSAQPSIPKSDDPNATVPFWRHLLASHWTWPAIAAVASFVLVMWPWMLRGNRQNCFTGASAGVALAAATHWIRPRGIIYVAAGAVGIALQLCMSVFHGSSAWYDCGIKFGTVHWPTMTMGQTDNLPGILRADYGWSDDLNAAALSLPAHSPLSLWSSANVDVSSETLLRGIFFVLLMVSAIGVGMHARRRDPRFLIAIVTPWLMFFCFPPQIHERYLLFAAGIACVCAGISTGMMLLGVLLSIITTLMTLHTMLAGAGGANLRLLGASLARQFPALFDKQAGNLLLRIANGTHPDLGFAVVLIGMVFLYFTIAPRPPARASKSPLTTPSPDSQKQKQ